MSETVADLELDDEHVTIGLEDTLVEGCKRSCEYSIWNPVVLDDEDEEACHRPTPNVESHRKRC